MRIVQGLAICHSSKGYTVPLPGHVFLWYMAALKGLSHREAKTRVNELLELVNLKDAADRRIGGYSGE